MPSALIFEWKGVNGLIWEQRSILERILFIIIVVFIVSFIWIFIEKMDSDGHQEDPFAITENSADIPASAELEESPARSEETNTIVIVDVKGAVKKPGVFQMDAGQRVNEAILLAGGFLDEADPNRVNLAQTVQDEMVIYVPEFGEEDAALEQVSVEKDDGKVNLNKAESSELETIPGIGPSKAKAIIAFREENGDFNKIEDLTNVPGIGDKTLESIKDYISVSK